MMSCLSIWIGMDNDFPCLGRCLLGRTSEAEKGWVRSQIQKPGMRVCKRPKGPYWFIFLDLPDLGSFHLIQQHFFLASLKKFYSFLLLFLYYLALVDSGNL
jgi:hypothetical protein